MKEQGKLRRQIEAGEGEEAKCRVDGGAQANEQARLSMRKLLKQLH